MRDFAYYKRVLNIQGVYDEDILKKAFREAVKANHPDKFKNPINKKLATEKMKIINEAYEYLKNNIDKQPSDNNFKEHYKESQDKHYSKESTQEKESYKEEQKDSDIIKDLEIYIKNRSTITIEYKLKTGKLVSIEILPLELNHGLYGQNFIYLKALACLQNKVKTYRVDRIIKIKVLDKENRQQETNYSNDFTAENSYDMTSKKDIWNLTVLLPIITGIVIILSFFKVPYTIYMLLRVLVCLTLFNTVLTLRKFLPIWAILLCVGGICLYNPIYLVHLSKSVWQLLNMGILVVIIHLLNGYFKNE